MGIWKKFLRIFSPPYTPLPGDYLFRPPENRLTWDNSGRPPASAKKWGSALGFNMTEREHEICPDCGSKAIKSGHDRIRIGGEMVP